MFELHRNMFCDQYITWHMHAQSHPSVLLIEVAVGGWRHGTMSYQI
jgi:hypothetical protein